MLQSTMQDFPLTVGMIFRHGRAVFGGDSEVVTFEGETCRRASFARGRRARRPARGRRSRGWASSPATGSAPSCGTPRSTSRRTSRFPAIGAVLHTLNIRLFPEQLAYIVNHAERPDRDRRRQSHPGARHVSRRELKTVERVLVVGDGDVAALEAVAPRHRDPAVRRRCSAASDRHRVRVSRGRRAVGRGDVLHERHHRQPEGRRLLAPVDVPARAGVGHRLRSRRYTSSDRVLPIVPMFHANAWGAPVRGVDGGRRPPDARPVPAGRATGEVVQPGADHPRVRGPDDLRRLAPLLRDPRGRLLAPRAASRVAAQPCRAR